MSNDALIGPVPDLFEGDVLQFRKLVLHVRITEGENCVRINQIVALVENIIVYKGQE